MINRVLIRIKVVQMLYSYLLANKSNTPLYRATEELANSMDAANELYYSLFSLMIQLTRLQEMKLHEAKLKYLPTEEDINPNTRFVENEFIQALQENETLKEHLKKSAIDWSAEPYLFNLLDKIRKSEDYINYMAAPTTDFAADVLIWREILKKVIVPDENFAETLESHNIYWNDDLETISTFALKTMRRWADGEEQTFIDKFKDKEDAEFGNLLFSHVVRNTDEYNQLIDEHLEGKAWRSDRIAFMDRVIMQTAIAEVIHFPKIPLHVTLNEYIEIAKHYSTPNSGGFVNGVLHAVFTTMRERNLTNKKF